MQGKVVYIKPKVVRHFPEPCASGSYLHRAAFFKKNWLAHLLLCFQVREETYTAFENIYPVLTEFRKVQQWYVFCYCD
jgi:hypothetical protein